MHLIFFPPTCKHMPCKYFCPKKLYSSVAMICPDYDFVSLNIYSFGVWGRPCGKDEKRKHILRNGEWQQTSCYSREDG